MTGVDNDAAMLDRARTAWEGSGGSEAGGSLTLIEHDLTSLDLTTLDLAARFGLVLIALNSFLLLDGRAAQERALKVMRAHLAPEGRAVIDVWTPTADDLELYDGRQVLDWIRTDPHSNERVAKTTVAHYDAVTNTAQLTTTFDIEGDGGTTRSITRRDAISFVEADELLDLANRAGLVPEQVLGDYDGAAWSEASERVVLLCGAG